MTEHDSDIAARFAALKGEVERAAPPFAVPAPSRRAGRPARTWWAAAAVIAGFVLWRVTVTESPALPRGAVIAIDPSATAWVSPTDFLLETPGTNLLRAVPKIGFQSGAARRPLPTEPSPERS